MRVFALIITIICLLSLALPLPGLGDELHLTNGDRLTGEAVRMEEGALFFKTPYVSGEMEIAWDNVANLSTDKPVRVMLEDGTLLNGRTLIAEQGKMKMKMGAIVETVSFDLDKVKAVNPEQSGPGGGAKFKGEVNAGVAVSEGNTETSGVHVNAEMVARTKVNRYTAGMEYNYESSDDETTARNALAYGKYDYFFTEKWYLYANTLFETDPVADLRLRSTLGAGLGYQFLETDRANLYVEAGPSYVNEDLEEDEDTDSAAGRWAVNFDYAMFDWVEFFHFHEGYQGVEDSDNLFVRTRTGLKFPIAESFHSTIQYNWDYDKSPGEDAEKIDRKYLFTLGYTIE